MKLHIVAAHGLNREIGVKGGLPWSLKGDLARFKAYTMGHAVVMGRRTWESIGRPLPGRVNVVVSSTLGPTPGVMVVPTLERAMAMGVGSDVSVIGGAKLYEAAIPYANQMYLTHVTGVFSEADVFFPQYDRGEWFSDVDFFYPKDDDNPFDCWVEILKRKF